MNYEPTTDSLKLYLCSMKTSLQELAWKSKKSYFQWIPNEAWTHWGNYKMAIISHVIFSISFLLLFNRNYCILIKISLKFVPKGWIDPSHCKSHNASDKYPTIYHFITEMCTYVYISVTKCCIVGYGTDALWDLWDWSIDNKAALVKIMACCWTDYIPVTISHCLKQWWTNLLSQLGHHWFR